MRLIAVRNLQNGLNKENPILAPFFELKYVCMEQQPIRIIFFDYIRDAVRFLGLWPDQKALKNRFYKAHTALVVLMLTVFWSTIAGDFYTAGNNIVVIGESIMFLMGVSIIYFKALLILKNRPQINEIVEIFKDLWSRNAAFQNPSIIKLQRNYFIGEVGTSLFFHMISLFLFTTLSIQPLLTGQSTPIPALFPFNLQQPEAHPWGAHFVYAFQVFAIFYSLMVILNLDLLGGISITQTSLNLRILAIRLRELGSKRGIEFKMLDELREIVEFHQKIIAVNSQCNETFYGTYILQMSTSTFMLGLAGFETLNAKDQPMVAFKFLFFMCTATFQLLYWCMVGNMVYFDSQDVAVAAFDAHKWYEQSPILQRNLMFVILRAQKPLVFRAKPFMPFTFETFTKVIKTSYTSFTLLCNTSE